MAKAAAANHRPATPFPLERQRLGLTALNRDFRPDQDALRKLDKKTAEVIFRLRTGHCGLRANLKSMGQTDTAICHCGNDDQTPEHVLYPGKTTAIPRKVLMKLKNNNKIDLVGRKLLVTF